MNSSSKLFFTSFSSLVVAGACGSLILFRKNLKLSLPVSIYASFTLLSANFLPRLTFAGKDVEYLRFLEWLKAYRINSCRLESACDKMLANNTSEFLEFHSLTMNHELVLDLYQSMIEEINLEYEALDEKYDYFSFLTLKPEGYSLDFEKKNAREKIIYN